MSRKTAQPNQCPKCTKPEDIKHVRRHCEHEDGKEEEEEAEEGGLGMRTVILFGFGLFIGQWLMYTICQMDERDATLLEVLRSQWCFFWTGSIL